MTAESSRTIARNTMYLYFRTIVTLLISLYTSRVILRMLGVEDFGIYNLVGGIVILCSFINNATTQATQRFLNFELGRGDLNQTGRVFSMSMTVHLTMIVAVVLIAETIGLWFLNTQLNIPPERMNAANWVFQFSLLGVCMGIIRVPYTATVLAYEKMSFYAVTSIVESALKLAAVFLLAAIAGDRLISYSILIFGISVVMFVIYRVRCRGAFPTSRYRFERDKALYRRLMSFSGWSLFGSTANVAAEQGVNMLLNIFWGVTVNAATGIANQVRSAVYNFVTNFQIAFRPQIVKSYAAGETSYLLSLNYRAAKFSYYILLALSVPVILNTDYILGLWLTTVPEFTAVFCQLVLIFSLIESLSGPLWITAQATGKIRNYQIVIGTMILCNIIFSYAALRLGMFPATVYLIRIAISAVVLGVRVRFLKRMIGLDVGAFMRNVIARIVLVTAACLPAPLLVALRTEGMVRLLLSTAVFLGCFAVAVWFLGITDREKEFLKGLLSGLLSRKKTPLSKRTDL